HVPPAAADRLLLEPVPVLFERGGGRYGVPRLVADSGSVSAGPLPLRCAGCELSGGGRSRARPAAIISACTRLPDAISWPAPRCSSPAACARFRWPISNSASPTT